MRKAVAMLRTLRPRQWVKNSFVLAPLVFSKHLFDTPYTIRALLATAAFCAVSGAVYAFNDVVDVEQDRQHPVKKLRPIAAGAIGQRSAIALSILLAAGSLVGTLVMDWRLSAVLAGYLVNNLAYSLYLKRVAFLDVAMIAAGFVLRVVAGGLAIGVPLSPWLIACTALLAGLLGFGKRAHELLAEGDGEFSGTTTRHALRGYRANHLRVAMLILALATCTAYGLYTRDARTIEYFGTGKLLYTLPFCVVGILRFAQLSLWRPSRLPPTDAMLRDGLFMLNIAAWGAAVLAVIYLL